MCKILVGHILDVCQNGNEFARPSAAVANRNDDIFVKDDHAVYMFDTEGGRGSRAIGLKELQRPYGKCFC